MSSFPAEETNFELGSWDLVHLRTVLNAKTGDWDLVWRWDEDAEGYLVKLDRFRTGVKQTGPVRRASFQNSRIGESVQRRRCLHAGGTYQG